MRRFGRILEIVLEVGALSVAIVAFFQQNQGIRAGAVFVAALAVTLAVVLWSRLSRRRRLVRRERRVVDKYFGDVVGQFLRELPLPHPIKAGKLADSITNKSAYIAVPYEAFTTASALPP